MFQNISDEEIEIEEINNKKNIFKEIFNLKNVLLYIVSFLVSQTSFGDFSGVFALAIFAATCSNKIPSGIVYIITGAGVLLKFGKASFLMYLIISLVFIAFAIIFKPKVEDEERNEKSKLGGSLFLAAILVQLVSLLFGQLYLYNVLSSISFSILTYIFYKIFANGIVVIREFREKAAFSIEEIMAASILITISIAAFGDITLFGFSITNIVCILMVLILGWKNGLLVGVTAGTTIGIILGMVTASDPLLVAAYAISGLMAGILNKLRKDRCGYRIRYWKHIVYICCKWSNLRNYTFKRNYCCINSVTCSSKKFRN